MDLTAFLMIQMDRLESTNNEFIQKIIDQSEGLTLKIQLEMSHILNVHHQVNSRLNQLLPESNDWDKLPLVFWERLNRDNCEVSRQILSETSEESLQFVALSVQHIFMHSVYHRSRLVNFMQQANMNIPSTNFVNLV